MPPRRRPDATASVHARVLHLAASGTIAAGSPDHHRMSTGRPRTKYERAAFAKHHLPPPDLVDVDVNPALRVQHLAALVDLYAAVDRPRVTACRHGIMLGSPGHGFLYAALRYAGCKQCIVQAVHAARCQLGSDRTCDMCGGPSRRRMTSRYLRLVNLAVVVHTARCCDPLFDTVQVTA